MKTCTYFKSCLKTSALFLLSLIFALSAYCETLSEQKARMEGSVKRAPSGDVFIETPSSFKLDETMPIHWPYLELVAAFNPEINLEEFLAAIKSEKSLYKREEMFRKDSRELFEADCRKSTFSSIKPEIDAGRPVLAYCFLTPIECSNLAAQVKDRAGLKTAQELKTRLEKLSLSPAKPSGKRQYPLLILGYNPDSKEYLVSHTKAVRGFWLSEKYFKEFLDELYIFKSVKKDK